ncbi:hypothetical protein KQI69_03700 [Eubacterium sp. MSJ-13]|uniref:hypothetical protein n=1 Tax=Eubacterium sp. MSJ-13 TaxID=2841513 RepID=UPI001C0F9B9A|nr:hypothetical protein [Eubacterium sp. MSJ-13]MBU5478304.1 hypothetical protein [Eubacterium sp. MSJ-13]
MEKVVIGLYEKTSYAERFAEYFCHNKNNCIDFRIFTIREKISEFTKKTRIDVLLTDRQYADDVNSESNVGKIIILSEGNYVMENEKYPVIFKYQSVEEIIKEVLADIAEDDNIDVNNTSVIKNAAELIGVYSASGGNIPLDYGVGLAVKTGKIKKTLLVCLEQLNGLDGAAWPENETKRKISSSYEEVSYVRGMSEVIYYLNKSGNKLALKLQSIVCRRSGIDCIYPVEDYRDLGFFDKDMINEFINVVSKQMEYEVVIFIIGYLSEAFMELMQRCDKLYFKAAQDGIERERQNAFENMLKRDGLSGKLDNVVFFGTETNLC